jgi:hypothetical protein
MNIKLATFLVGFFLFEHSSSSSDISTYKSPDNKSIIEITRSVTNESVSYSISFIKCGELLFSVSPPLHNEAREIKVSWAPSSEAAIIGINFKASEDWILVRYTNGKEVLSYIDGDKLLTKRMFKTLPFQDQIKNSAPHGGVPWKTVQWEKPLQGKMTYYFHGIGYEGNANLSLDFTSEAPSIKVESILPIHRAQQGAAANP